MHNHDRIDFEAGDDPLSEFDLDDALGSEFDLGGEEAQELNELATDLLAVTNDQELDEFFFKKILRKAHKAVRSPAGRAVTRALRGVAKVALPIAGRAAGTYFGGPAGAAVGGALGDTLGGMVGGGGGGGTGGGMPDLSQLMGAAGVPGTVMIPGLGPINPMAFLQSLQGGAMQGELGDPEQDLEFEVAKRISKVVKDGVRMAASLPPTANPAAAVRAVVSRAAQKVAPGLLQAGAAMLPSPTGSLRAVRRGNRIIIYL